MKPETLEALQGSIKKWELVVAGTGENRGCDNCPLCERFSGDYCVSADDEKCPVAIKTGCTECVNTPYYECKWGFSTKPEDVAAAQAELDFLRGLLPDILPSGFHDTNKENK